MPPESVASVVSLPITSFEDTQQMLKAYKKKKRELTKLKEMFFKMETEFMTIKQKNIILEEELAAT
jgi:predicted  nucleic acid-binding Zn-ribbon protein